MDCTMLNGTHYFYSLRWDEQLGHCDREHVVHSQNTRPFLPPSQLHQHSLEHSLHVRSIILALVLVDVIFPVSF